LGVEELAAVVSVFNRAGKPGDLDKGNVTEPVIAAMSQITDIKTRLAEVEEKLEIPIQQVEDFSANLASVTLAWA
jgi:superfamily II RNA helicase